MAESQAGTGAGRREVGERGPGRCAILVQRGEARAREVRRAFIRVMEGLPAGKGNERSLPQLPGLNATLRSRVSRALASASGSECLYHLPGPEALRSVLSAAGEAGAKKGAVAEAEEAVRGLELFFAEEEIDRDSLHALLGTVMPEARKARVKTNSQLAFKARMNLEGYGCETFVTLCILTPSDVAGRCDVALVTGCIGWRFLHHDSWPCVFGAMSTLDQTAAGPVRRRLDGTEAGRNGTPPLIAEFCAGALPEFEPVGGPGTSLYVLKSEHLGVRSDSTFFFGEILPRGEPSEATETERAILGGPIPVPCRRMVFDTVVHRSIAPGVRPEVECYRVGALGAIEERTRSARRFDRVEMDVEMEELGEGLSHVDTPAVPRYGALVEHAMRLLGREAVEFRGYRCDVAYPLEGVQVCTRLRLDAGRRNAED